MNTTTVPSNGDTLIHVLVTVTAVDGAEHHPEDLDNEGKDAISGNYGFTIHPDAAAGRDDDDDLDPAIEEALDEFHDDIAIKVLDNFDIVAKRIASDDAPADTSWH